MKLLLDTHAFIWWDCNPGLLSPAALSAIQDPANEVWLSVVSVWEIVIKSQLGKMALRLPLADIVAQQQGNGLRVMNIDLHHVLTVNSLPQVHSDPFDRLLAAQSIVEAAELVTKDAIFAQYPVRLLW